MFNESLNAFTLIVVTLNVILWTGVISAIVYLKLRNSKEARQYAKISRDLDKPQY